MAPRALLLLALVCAGAFAREDPPAYLVLVAADADEGHRSAAEVIRSIHAQATLRTFDPARLDDLLPILRTVAPRYVCLVLPRERIDVRFVRRFYLMATQIDDDPFPDFSYGFVTGDDGAGALAFARSIERASNQERWNRVLQVMTRDGEESTTGSEMIEGGSSYVERCWLSIGADDAAKEESLALLADCDLISITAHGDVGGMAGGYWSTHIDRSGPDLEGAVVVSSVCYSGVVSRRFDVGADGDVDESDVDVGNSFALALLRRGAGAYVAGVDSMHGLYTGRVFDAILLEGASVGDAVKALQDRMVMEMIDRSFPPERLLEMERLASDEQVATVANLVVYGDPAFRLYSQQTRRPSPTGIRMEVGGRRSMFLTMEVREFEASDHVRSKYRSDGDRWGTEWAFTLRLQEGLEPRSIRVPRANVKAMNGVDAHFAVESLDGVRFLHVVIPFDADEAAVTEQVGKEGYRIELEIESEAERR